jgi:DMSO/TMAO reductase YedYZ heme-binding membrane subunit
VTDPARNRFFVMGISRVLGVALALFGLVLTQNIPGRAGMIAGIILILAGLAAIAFLPRALARRWRTPPE